jgi:hypothetical protein
MAAGVALGEQEARRPVTCWARSKHGDWRCAGEQEHGGPTMRRQAGSMTTGDALG